jgi:hypothetical protein
MKEPYSRITAVNGRNITAEYGVHPIQYTAISNMILDTYDTVTASVQYGRMAVVYGNSVQPYGYGYGS